jgi:hypothetical protein
MQTIRRTVIAFTVLAAVALSPAVADIFTVHLTNGATFETRYQPKIAVGDGTKVLFVTDVGNRIYVHREDISEITHSSDVQGFGTMINTTTIALGWAPNDNPVPGEADPRADMLNYLRDQQRARPDYSVDQFVSTEDAGVSGGLPAWDLAPGTLGGGGQTNVFVPPPAAAPAPAEGGGGPGGGGPGGPDQ